MLAVQSGQKTDYIALFIQDKAINRRMRGCKEQIHYFNEENKRFPVSLANQPVNGFNRNEL